ncbi:hypothetical protein MKW94_002631 [Papaver nudicaule]|uniref:Uncharacterized protein n=1 Tax=Papaver nudicaule TaxID=74823 RepID=A0AA41RZS7_PAPNU|nr:hypothetical protein [Papaver nudicaule]
MKYWKQMILLHILKKEILVDQLYKENTELFERAFLIRFLAVLYLFGLATLLLYTLFE